VARHRALLRTRKPPERSAGYRPLTWRVEDVRLLAARHRLKPIVPGRGVTVLPAVAMILRPANLGV
jgi:hypothetical protein